MREILFRGKSNYGNVGEWEYGLVSQPHVTENGYCAKCTLSQKKAVDCLTGKKSHYIQKPTIKGGANG